MSRSDLLRAPLAVLFSLSLALGGLTGCDRGNKAGGDTPAGESGKGQSAAKGAAGASGKAVSDFPAVTSTLKAAKAMQNLPAETVMVGAIGSYASLAEKAGRKDLILAHPEVYGEIVREMKAEMGHDLLDPATHDAFGVNAKGPVGAALLDLRQAHFALFFSLSDRTRFETAVKAQAIKAGKSDGDIVREVVGANALITFKNEDGPIVLVTDDAAFLLGTDGDTDQLNALARTMAELKPEQSLASSARFKESFDHLARGGDAAGWVNLDAILKQMQAPVEPSVSPWLKEQLAEAKASGDPQEIKNAEKRIADDQRWAERRAKREAEEARVLAKALEGVHGVAAGVDIDGATLRTRVLLVTEGNAPLKALFPAGKGNPALVQALSKTPFMLSAGQLDLKAVMTWADGIANAVGMPGGLATAKGFIKGAAGVDLDAEVLPLLTGQIGFAVTADVKAMIKADEPQTHFGGAFVLGINDEAKAGEVLGKLFALPPLKEELGLKAEGKHRWRITVPDFKDVVISVGGGHIAFSPDAGFHDRLAALKSPDFSKSFVTQVKHPGLKALLQRGDASQLWINDTFTLGYMMFMGRMSWEMPLPTPPEPPPAGWTAKVEAYQKARKTLDDMETAHQNEQAALMMEIFQTIGTQAFALTPNEHGLLIDGGQYLGASDFKSAVATIASVPQKAEQQRRAHREKERPLEEQTEKLRRELQDMAMGGSKEPQRVVAPIEKR